jgi:4-alpha-glucanotransferase
MSDETLRVLATKAGIAPHWTDQTGAERAVSPDSLRAILFALGLPADSDQALRNSLSLMEVGGHPSASHFTTARVGQPVGLPIASPGGTSVEMTLEGGAHRVVTSEDGYDGALTLPAFDEPGYHTVRTAQGDFTVATAPERCITFADLNGGAPGWGLAAQIYSLRSQGDGGIGNFAGVAALARRAASRGADALAISPVHALYGAEPTQFSPYSPSTRLFYNPLHADPAAAIPAELIQDVIATLGLGEEMGRLSTLPRVDWVAATPQRQKLLRGLFDALRDPARGLELAQLAAGLSRSREPRRGGICGCASERDRLSDLPAMADRPLLWRGPARLPRGRHEGRAHRRSRHRHGWLGQPRLESSG